MTNLVIKEGMKHLNLRGNQEAICAMLSTIFSESDGLPPFVICMMQGPKLHWMVSEDDNESAVYADELIPSAT